MTRTLTWRNVAGDQRCHPRRIEHPSSTAALSELVREAERTGTTIRAVGAGHAWSDVALTDGILVETDRMTGIVEQLGDDRVRVRGGTRIRDLNAALDARGLGLINMGGYDGQSIAGVVSTSTHGSGLAFGPFPDYVESIDLVASGGRIVRLERGDEDFPAAVCAMGCMGIVDSLVLRVRPRFWLRERRVVRTWAEVRGEVDARLAAEDHYELFLDPYSGTLLETTRSETPEPGEGSPGDGERHPLIEIQSSIPLVWAALRLAARVAPSLLRTQFGATLRRMADPNYTQVSHRVFNIGAANHLPALSSELAVPIEGDNHLRTVDRILEIARELADRRRLFHTSPLALRFVAASGAYASMMHERPTMMIELILVAETRGGPTLLTEYERRLAEFGARPHWGQFNVLGPRDPAALYPRWADWLRTYERMNATAVFDSHFTDRIGISRGSR
jgi:FAD/FMN-containing dehydrogenase